MRWALLLAIDIADYMGMAVDGTGAISPVHIPSLANYPKDFIEPMLPWLEEFTLDIGNGETFKPYDPNASQRIVEYAKGRGYKFPEDPGTSGQGVWQWLVQVRARRGRKAAGQERLQQERRRQVAAARRHTLEDRVPDRTPI